MYVLERRFSNNRQFQVAGVCPVMGNPEGLTEYKTEQEARDVQHLIERLENQFPGMEVGIPEDYRAYAEYCGGVGHFVINTEDAENGAYLDYWNRYENSEINKILSAHKLWIEWQNAAVAVVFPL